MKIDTLNVHPPETARRRRLALGAAALCILWLGACAGLQPPKAEDMSIYVLEADTASIPKGESGPLALLVSPPRAWPGFDTPRMAYMQQSHQVEYFSRSRWVDAPARMLGPLLVQALDHSGRFSSVTNPSGASRGDVRLETEIIRLQQEFMERPSKVRLIVRATVIHLASRRIVAAREFEVTENAPDDDPYGGVVAANRAVTRLLGQLVEFCAESVEGLSPADKTPSLGYLSP